MRRAPQSYSIAIQYPKKDTASECEISLHASPLLLLKGLSKCKIRSASYCCERERERGERELLEEEELGRNTQGGVNVGDIVNNAQATAAEAVENANTAAQNGMDAANEAVQNAEATAAEAVENANTAAQNGMDAANEAVQNAQATAAEAVENADTAAQSGMDAANEAVQNAEDTAAQAVENANQAAQAWTGANYYKENNETEIPDNIGAPDEAMDQSTATDLVNNAMGTEADVSSASLLMSSMVGIAAVTTAFVAIA
ncbi:hypothetical protein FRACYDRAFT_233728 [Fragilariopsis cylindrus CCMP1102]|uniref:Uncharacterized protein n=1 Tax=Fragilariopsis cylindrus CCMP1102 TaxID=635003 RepID=A0A1E7FZL9_9STRA|nr:hypothetical protein FRACYDRAFT_233728 [Fragilariopsis cylindrus CCMP1102]|eukprot:OEU23554.1 hypothetical protein FRACYDRAFT_233728 [Fragilariopsis cylindrus CCMP1102]